jgi:hypothetical protein
VADIGMMDATAVVSRVVLGDTGSLTAVVAVAGGRGHPEWSQAVLSAVLLLKLSSSSSRIVSD